MESEEVNVMCYIVTNDSEKDFIWRRHVLYKLNSYLVNSVTANIN